MTPTLFWKRVSMETVKKKKKTVAARGWREREMNRWNAEGF